MRSEDIKQQISKLETELAVARKYEQQLESGSPTAIAELLHSKQCRWNHIDGCGWEYENWENPGHARQEYREKAVSLLAKAKAEGIDPPQLIRIIQWF